MSEIHEEMEAWLRRTFEKWGCSDEAANKTLVSRLGVEPAAPGAPGVAEVLEVLGDGEAHTTETISDYLEMVFVDLSGCQIAACLGRLEMDGHAIKMLGPYDIFGSPGRFKLEVRP